jgi:DNA-binding winged helix-turn-helix (wHTH) protein/TolB-like protein/tetratricopeptide (TPR) repeat protein
MSHQPKPIYEFGPYRLDAAEHLLSRDGETVPLQPKVFDLLLVMVERHGRLLEKDELIKAVWPDTVVEEANLANNISILRKTIGENGRQYIETAPKRGYRFVAEVREVGSDGLAPTAQLPIAVEEKVENIEEAAARQKWAPWRKATTIAGVALLCVAGGVYFWFGRKAEKVAPDSIKSIAVLPFKPLNRSQDDEYLGIGLADAVITRLSGAGKIIVRSTGSVSKYAALTQDPIMAGREQQVDAVLDASLWRSGEKVRVTARLLRVRDGMPLWIWEREELCTDVFAVQTLISEQVAGALMPQLTGAERARLTRRYTEDREANMLYAQGRFNWNKRTEEGLKKGIECYQRAVDKDPNYVLAYAGLAECYVTLVGLAYGDPVEFLPKAKAYAVKALEIDNTLAEAHAPLAAAKKFEWDWSGAEKEYRRAIELNPGYAIGHKWYSLLLAARGRFEESFAEIEQDLALDPVSLIGNQGLGLRLYYARRDDQAIEQLRKTLEMDPNFLPALVTLGEVYTHKEKYTEALAELNKAAALSRDNALAALGYTYAVSGERSKARQALAELQEMSKRRYVSPIGAAAIYTGLGEKDQAFAWLERGFKGRAIGISFLKIDPKFDSLRSDPRFAVLLRRIGLAP